MQACETGATIDDQSFIVLKCIVLLFSFIYKCVLYVKVFFKNGLLWKGLDVDVKDEVLEDSNGTGG